MLRRVLIVLTIACLLAGAAGLVAFLDTQRPVLREAVIEVPDLQHEVTLLQISDLHGATFGESQGDIAALLQGRTADAIVLTGDYTAGPSASTRPVTELVETLSEYSPVVIGVLGNHDTPKVRAEMESVGVIFPDAEAFPLGGDGAVVVFDSDARAAIGPVTTGGRSAVTVALRHVPPTASQIGDAGAASPEPLVYLSGHTHGGQLRIPFIGAIRAPVGRHFSAYSLHEWRTESFPDLRGFHMIGRYDYGDDTLWVSPGLGTAFVPVRFWCRSGIELIRLVPEG